MEKRRGERGVTLVEILLTIVIVAVLAGMVLDSATDGYRDRLSGAAQVISGDLDYARHLAINNNSKYSIDFDFANDQYTLTHSGTNVLLNVLPRAPFRSPTDSATQQVVALRELPAAAAAIDLYEPSGGTGTGTARIEFGPTGATTQTTETTIWLATGSGSNRLYLPVRVAPATGLVAIGEVTAISPNSTPDINLPLLPPMPDTNLPLLPPTQP